MIEYKVLVGRKYTKWYHKDQLHRSGGPAIEYEDGTKMFYQRGQLHREGAPAIEYANGYREWYENGELHREGGPAIEGNGDRQYFLKGLKYSEEEFRKKMNL